MLHALVATAGAEHAIEHRGMSPRRSIRLANATSLANLGLGKDVLAGDAGPRLGVRKPATPPRYVLRERVLPGPGHNDESGKHEEEVTSAGHAPKLSGGMGFPTPSTSEIGESHSSVRPSVGIPLS